MAKYSGNYLQLAGSTGIGDTSAMANDTYVGLLGVTSARLSVYEIYMGGEASASAPQSWIFARSSTIAGTPVAGKAKTALLDGTGQAPTSAPTTFTQATSGSQRSSTLHLLHLSFNAFGGIVRWVAAPGSEIQMYGATATAGESNLSQFTSSTSAATSGHILFEAL